MVNSEKIKFNISNCVSDCVSSGCMYDKDSGLTYYEKEVQQHYIHEHLYEYQELLAMILQVILHYLYYH